MVSSVPGRPSRAAVSAALAAYVAVQKGEPLKRALQEALREATKLGGQERRFTAFAVRDILRNQALIDWAAKRLGTAPGALPLVEDRSLVRYTLWRRVVTQAPWARIREEVKLPGPLRPRSLPDSALEALATAEAGVLEAEAAGLEPSVRFSFPRWLTERMGPVVPPEELPLLLAALNAEPPLVLRARPPGTAEAVQAELKAQGVEASAVGQGTDALILEEASHKVFDTRLFRDGRLQVQDLGSQLIVQLCRPEAGFAGGRVADICAGAGGKTLYLADLVGTQGRVDASDKSPRRLQEGRERSRRWGLKQVVFPSEPLVPSADVVLVDAPCSGTGSLAREPDQKWKLSPKAVDAWVATQAELLENTAAQVKPGGVLVYATCSLLPDEDERQVEAFLERHPGFRLSPAERFIPRGFTGSDGRYLRLVPHRHPGGGFFAARLERAPAD